MNSAGIRCFYVGTRYVQQHFVPRLLVNNAYLHKHRDHKAYVTRGIAACHESSDEAMYEVERESRHAGDLRTEVVPNQCAVLRHAR